MGTKNTPEQDMKEDVQIDETAAADTLNPGAGSGGTESRAQMTAAFVQLLAQLGKEDLTDLFNRTLDQIGHEADQTPGDPESNQATIMAKPSSAQGMGTLPAMPMPVLGVQEDIDDMFAGDVLTEEQKERASVIFEAALNTRISIELLKLEEDYNEQVNALEEAYENKLEEELSEAVSEVSEKLDQYLDYAVQEWMNENELAIENSLRTEIAEDFMGELKNLFINHNISIPEERMDVFAEMKSELEEVKSRFNEVLDENLSLREMVEESERESIVDEVSEGLTLTQMGKLHTLVEGVEFTDTDSFKRKVEIIKENYFSDKRTEGKTGLISEEIGGEDGEELNEGSSQPFSNVNRYAKAIKKPEFG